MSIPTPTTKQVADNIIAQLESTLNQTIPLMPKAFNRVLAQALAAVLMTIYKFAGWIFLQIFVSTASNRYFMVNGRAVNPLVEWGVLVGAGQPRGATQAVLTLEISVLTVGGSLSAGTQLVGVANGVTYLTEAAVLLNASVVSVEARAVSDQSGGGGSGTVGNLPIGAIVQFANTLPNVSQSTVVTGAVTTGADAETTELYRQRIVNLFQRRPQGGAYIDYGIWGLEPEGILNIYPYTGYPGEVDVYVESATEVDGIPTLAQLEAVSESIELDEAGLATRRPANAFVNVYPITRSPFTVEVAGISNVDNLAETQTDVTDAVSEYFLQREPYIPGYSVGVNRSAIVQNSLAGIVSAVVASHGGFFSTLTVRYAGIPVNYRPLNEGEKAKLGAPVDFS